MTSFDAPKGYREGGVDVYESAEERVARRRAHVRTVVATLLQKLASPKVNADLAALCAIADLSGCSYGYWRAMPYRRRFYIKTLGALLDWPARSYCYYCGKDHGA